MTTGNRIGQLAAEMIEHIEATYPDGHVGCVAIVCDVSTDRGDGVVINPIEFGCNDSRRWVQLALLDEAVKVAEAMNDERVAKAAENDD